MQSTTPSRRSYVTRRIGNLRRWTLGEFLTTGHVLIVMAVVELSIRFVPLTELGRRLGVPVDLEPTLADSDQLPVEQLPLRARAQLRCTARIADVWPFSRGPCLRRALVGGHLIRDLRPMIRLGITGGGDSLLAHAWLEVDGRALEPIGQFARFEQAPGTIRT